jgi:hypothetical protein
MVTTCARAPKPNRENPNEPRPADEPAIRASCKGPAVGISADWTVTYSKLCPGLLESPFLYGERSTTLAGSSTSNTSTMLIPLVASTVLRVQPLQDSEWFHTRSPYIRLASVSLVMAASCWLMSRRRRGRRCCPGMLGTVADHVDQVR